jgi:glutathione-independent formaldehyde dehydrogenase
MKAVVWRGERRLDIETVEDARLEAPTDVLMRLTSTAICGTDLHIYEGRMGEVDGMVIGHEPLGVVEAVGSSVVSLRKGDLGWWYPRTSAVAFATTVCAAIAPRAS